MDDDADVRRLPACPGWLVRLRPRPGGRVGRRRGRLRVGVAKKINFRFAMSFPTAQCRVAKTLLQARLIGGSNRDSLKVAKCLVIRIASREDGLTIFPTSLSTYLCRGRPAGARPAGRLAFGRDRVGVGRMQNLFRRYRRLPGDSFRVAAPPPAIRREDGVGRGV